MIISKLNKHSEMKREYFRAIPELLEKPIIVQFSDAIDGRNILYDINKLTVIGHGDVPSNSNKSRGSHINTNNGKKTIPQPPEKSNTPDGRKAKDDTIDADYLSAVERGDMETAQRMVDEGRFLYCYRLFFMLKYNKRRDAYGETIIGEKGKEG